MRTRMGVRALMSSSSVWRWSSSAEVSFLRHPEAARATNTQQTWWQEFLGSRSSTVERSSIRTAAAGTFLRFFQAIFENTPLWRLKRLVTLSTYRRYINECMYVSIYLSRSLVRSPGTHFLLVLLRIPSSRPSPRTFPQFIRVQVLGFLAAENDGFET